LVVAANVGTPTDREHRMLVGLCTRTQPSHPEAAVAAGGRHTANRRTVGSREISIIRARVPPTSQLHLTKSVNRVHVRGGRSRCCPRRYGRRVAMRAHELFFDAVFYNNLVTRTDGKWPLGGTLMPSVPRVVEAAPAERDTVPMSVRQAIQAFCSTNMKRNIPVVTADTPVVHTVTRQWQAAVAAVRSHTPAGTVQVPVSTVEHENSQLEWGRTGVRLCACGDECDATALDNNQGPLHVYFSVAEHDRFAANGAHPDRLFCLLCIRRDVHALALAFQASADPPVPFAVPPVQNLVDVPGGYIASALAVTADSSVLGAAVVGVCSGFAVRYNPGTKTWFVDQGRIIVGAAPDFRGAAGATA